MNSIKKKRKKKLQLVSFWQTSVGYVLIASALIASRREDAKKCGCFVSIRYDRICGVSKLGSIGYAYPGHIAPVSRIGMGYEGKMPYPCILGNYYGDKMSTSSYLEQVLPAILDGLPLLLPALEDCSFNDN